MGWLPSIFTGGIDTDAEQARGDELDRRLEEMNRRGLDTGLYTPDDYALREANRQAGATGDVNAQVNSEFRAGLQDGASNVVNFATQTVPGAINDALSGTVGTLWRSIPLSVWLIAGAALFVWMGGMTLLRGRLIR